MNKLKIFEVLEQIAPIIPAPLYWLDKSGVFLGGNQLCLEVTGAKSLDQFIGKSYNEIHSKEVAEKIVKNIALVVTANETVRAEEEIRDLSTGKTRYFLAIRAPLYENNEAVGIIATSIEITDKKEYENLKFETIRSENEKYKAKMEEDQVILKFIENMLHSLQSFKMQMLNNKIGVKPKLPQLSSAIKLTKREREVLYFLSLNKSPKEIANILSTIENKSLSPLTISSIIDKQLYPKFNVNNVSKLIEVANNLKLIPFSIS